MREKIPKKVREFELQKIKTIPCFFYLIDK